MSVNHLREFKHVDLIMFKSPLITKVEYVVYLWMGGLVLSNMVGSGSIVFMWVVAWVLVYYIIFNYLALGM